MTTFANARAHAHGLENLSNLLASSARALLVSRRSGFYYYVITRRDKETRHELDAPPSVATMIGASRALVLHHFGASSASYRVRIALGLKGLAFDTRWIDIRAGDQHADDYRRINPQGLVPCLEILGVGTIAQSSAIVEYLEESYPLPALLPTDPLERAQARSLAQLIHSDVAPFQKTTLQHHLAKDFAFDEAQRRRWLSFWMTRALAPLEQALEATKVSAGFAFGDRPGLVEVCLVPQLHNLRRFGVDLAPYKALLALEQKCLGDGAFAAAHPDRWRSP